MSENGVRKILVADNDEDVLVALEGILEEGGYATTTALSSAEACKLLSGGSFDVFLANVLCKSPCAGARRHGSSGRSA